MENVYRKKGKPANLNKQITETCNPDDINRNIETESTIKLVGTIPLWTV